MAKRKLDFTLIAITIASFIFLFGINLWLKIESGTAIILAAICTWIINYGSKNYAEEWQVNFAIGQLRQDVCDKSTLRWRLDEDEALYALAAVIWARRISKGMTPQDLIDRMQKDWHVKPDNTAMYQFKQINPKGTAEIKLHNAGMKLRPDELILTFRDGKLEKWKLREM